ncbi:MAG: hypothetical protein AAFR64_08010 [Pseudomonadota bacterium]
MRCFFLFGIGVLLAFSGFGLDQVRADSWAPPTTKTYVSQSGEYRFTVEPAPIESSLTYFREEITAREEGVSVERPAPLGFLEKLEDNGDWTPVWAAPLVNTVAPVSALVADDGAYVVTFDNWHSVGRGENVIVVYEASGAMVRSVALTDVLGEAYLSALPMSVSSTSWNRGKRLLPDGATLEIDLLVPEPDTRERKSETVPLRIVLADGSAEPMTGTQWDKARARALEVKALREEAERKRQAFFRDPLVGPSTCHGPGWHDYISEAFLRLTPGNPFGEFAATTVLFARDHERFDESVGWLREDLDDAWGEPRNVAFASPCDPEGMVEAVASITKDTALGAWPDSTIYVVGPEETYQKIEALLLPTGAKPIWVDPTRPIPQRPERIVGTPEYESALRAYNKAFMDDLDAM